MGVIANFWISFLAGLFAPLGAVCVLPLYPGFLAYLANKVAPDDQEQSKKTIISFGFIIMGGVLLSMFTIGLIFTGIFQSSLTGVIQIISPIAFGILGLISILLIFNFDLGRFFPQVHVPLLHNPRWSALLFGLFFGVIVLPCNPASLAVLFAVSTSISSFIANLFNFIFFGFGMSLPLLVLAIVSATASSQVIAFLTKYKKRINLVVGIIMLSISLYYLIFVFKIFG